MCGIVGFVPDNPFEDQAVRKAQLRVFRDMWLAAQSRGRDASGVAVLRPDGEHRIAKGAMPASRLIRTEAAGRILSPRPLAAVLGHTRFATVGDRDDPKNAHPFKAGDLLGVHNGTIRNPAVWARLFRLPRFGTTDSEVAIRLFAMRAAERPLNGADVAKVAEDLEGPSAFALADVRTPGVVYLTTNTAWGSTLWYVRDPIRNAVFFASTEAILREGLGWYYRTRPVSVPPGQVIRIAGGLAAKTARFDPYKASALRRGSTGAGGAAAVAVRRHMFMPETAFGTRGRTS